jgi:hypothetical protein
MIDVTRQRGAHKTRRYRQRATAACSGIVHDDGLSVRWSWHDNTLQHAAANASQRAAHSAAVHSTTTNIHDQCGVPCRRMPCQFPQELPWKAQKLPSRDRWAANRCCVSTGPHCSTNCGKVANWPPSPCRTWSRCGYEGEQRGTGAQESGVCREGWNGWFNRGWRERRRHSAKPGRLTAPVGQLGLASGCSVRFDQGKSVRVHEGCRCDSYCCRFSEWEQREALAQQVHMPLSAPIHDAR